jgi:DNA transformation protein and related proteins
MVGVKEGYTQGFIVSIELDSEILLKADAQSATQFEAAGFKHWTHKHKSSTKQVKMPL